VRFPDKKSPLGWFLSRHAKRVPMILPNTIRLDPARSCETSYRNTAKVVYMMALDASLDGFAMARGVRYWMLRY
jgi:hypothetical protein